MQILVVDDDPHIRRAYKEELEEEGYDVHLACSGLEGLKMFEEKSIFGSYDLVTLDLLMPDVDGSDVLRDMKCISPRTPVVISTAYDYRDDYTLYASDAYVVKSADLSELKNTIKELLSKK